MKWVDINDIAVELVETFPETDPVYIRFTELMAMVMALPGFDDTEGRCNEKVLEAIQAAWMAER